MVYVKGGTFTMGATAEQGSDVNDIEKPTHSVTLSDFYIGKYEVTQAQWKAIMGTTPSYFKGDNLPVEQVSWNDIQEFIQKLNAQTGKRFRLPTEAEWEYAARGGNKSKGYKYSGSNNVDEVAWYGDNSSNTIHPVGQKSPNELGIYDMSGNVYEWCQDWWGIYSSSPQTNPTGPSSGSYRVLRGGSWRYNARSCRVSYRDYDTPDSRNFNYGFRLALEAEGSDTPTPEPTTIPNNEIWYTSTDGNVVTPNATDVFGANIVSNTYENGKGIIKFDGEVTQIGERAFENCNILASVQIPLGVTEIGMGAFANTSLTSLIIPDNVTSIGGWICSYCTSLQTVTIGNDVTSIGEGTFFNNSSLKSVYCKPKTPPTLGKEVFGQNSYNRTIYVPSVSISAYKTAVNWSEYANYIIADPNSSYDDSAESNREIWYTSTDDNTVTPYTANAFGANIISNTYENGKGVIKFDGNVTKIGESAFFGCQNLKSVTIPESVTTIENNPFAYCDNLAEFNGKFVSADKHCIIVNNVLQSFTPISLKSYSIPNSIVSISNYAFVNCQSLTQIIIPKSISSIGNRAFDYCNSLKTVYCMPDTPPTLGDNAFGASSSTRKIYVPESLVNAYKTASNWSKYSSEIEPYPGYVVPEQAKTVTLKVNAKFVTDYIDVKHMLNISDLVKDADPNAIIKMAYLDSNGMMVWQDWSITDGWFGEKGATGWGDGCIACIKPKIDGSFEYIGLYPDKAVNGTEATAIFDYGNDVIVAIKLVVSDEQLVTEYRSEGCQYKPTSLTVQWPDFDANHRYTVRLADASGILGTWDVKFATTMLINGTKTQAYTRFTFGALTPQTEYTVSVKSQSADDSSYLSGTFRTDAVRAAGTNDVYWQGFDDCFFCGDSHNLAYGNISESNDALTLINWPTTTADIYANVVSKTEVDATGAAIRSTKIQSYCFADPECSLYGWTMDGCEIHSGYVKVGVSSTIGAVTTDVLGNKVLRADVATACIVEFKLSPRSDTNTCTQTVKLVVVHADGSQTVAATNIDPLTNGDPYNYTWRKITINNVRLLSTDKLRFVANVDAATGQARFHLDDILVVADPTAEPIPVVAYSENCGTSVEKSNGYWPYVDQFTGWARVSGNGYDQSAVSYTGVNASVRNSGAEWAPMGVTYASDAPYVYLQAKDETKFVINNIALKSSVNSYTLSFTAFNQYAGLIASPYTPITTPLISGENLTLYLSVDGQRWGVVNFTATTSGNWELVTAPFTLPAAADKLFVKFANYKGDTTTALPNSSYQYLSTLRIDDFCLIEGGNGPTIDFTLTDDDGGSAEPEPTVIPDNEIWYTSTDGKVVEPYSTTAFGVNIVSNTYTNGKGVISFDGKVTNIGDGAFMCNETISGITIPDSVTKIDNNAFRWCTNLNKVDMGNNVTHIGNVAFDGCTSLTSVTIPDSVTFIGPSAFLACYNLSDFYGAAATEDHKGLVIDDTLVAFAPAGPTEYTIPDGIKIVGEGCFNDCGNLTKVIIPATVTEIQEQAFYRCYKLATINCQPTTPPTLLMHSTYGTFDSNASDRKIYVPASSVDAYKTAENWSEYADAIVAEGGSEPEPNINVGGFDMVFVAGGTFTMGATAEQGSDADSDEKPTHSVTVSDFYIGKYEVTQAQWRAVMGSNPSNFTGDNNPVEKVSWDDIQEFIKKLNAQTGKRFRLPTEAEWEYAARGGNQSKGYKYSGSNSISDVAWYDDNSSSKTHPVGQKTPNELGIYDMSGNVCEWCQDWYGDYSSDAQTNPTGPSSGSLRVLRGGGWHGSARLCRVSNRSNLNPDRRIYHNGFRLVCLSE